jgi:FMN phosphatase YigB (HAD superfamily)
MAFFQCKPYSTKEFNNFLYPDAIKTLHTFRAKVYTLITVSNQPVAGHKVIRLHLNTVSDDIIQQRN